ncbi:MAG: Beta-lactamase precursor [Pseudomonadota bacterium]|jgi:glyoxylase-like metal-dependent hydrolase (beta-lactamase superfamily II)
MTMDRRDFIKGSCLGFAAVAAGPLLAAAPRPSATALTDRLRVISGVPGNVVALSTTEGLVLVDSGSAQQAPALRRLLGRERVKTLFNTHYHADQTGGNALFGRGGTEICAQVITKQWLAADLWSPAEDRWIKAPPKEAVPTTTFRERGGTTVGGQRIDYGYLLEAHTRGDCYVHFRDQDVLAVGDVASPERDPSLDWFAGGWLGGRVDAMDLLLGLAGERTRIVPAYGPVMTRAQLQAERDLMARLYERTTQLTAKGHSARDMLEAGVLKDVGREFQDPYRFLYDVAKGLQAHYTNFAGNVV